MIDGRDGITTADTRGELFGVHIPELQLAADDYRAGLRAARLTRGEQYLELGSGHGTGLVIAAGEFGAHATGIEYLEDAIERAETAADEAGVREQVELRRADLRTIDPTPFDVVHMHLGPAFHDVLAARLERLLTRDARVVTAGWRVPGWKPLDAALRTWDGGYVYRPADPTMQASWGHVDRTGPSPAWVELHAHADLTDLEVRVDGLPDARVAISHAAAARGTTVLVALPPGRTQQLTVWGRCRAGRFTQRGPVFVDPLDPLAPAAS